MDTTTFFTTTLPTVIDPALAESAWRLVQSAQRIVLFGHLHPDPDALGSTLGLAHVLRGLGKTCVVAVPDAPPPAYADFLPGMDAVVTTLDGAPFDLLIALDAGDLGRYGDLYPTHQAQLAGVPILNIDHHLTTTGCGVVNIIDPVAAATAELLTFWLAQLAVPIDRLAAQCLLAGIITDTRSFEFSATTSRTLLAGAYLVERGAVPMTIVKPMYRLKSFAAAQLFGMAVATVQRDLDGRLVWAYLTPEMWTKAGIPIGTEDDGLPTYLKDIIGTEIAICFRQTAPDLVRVSVRTTVAYDATAITTLFGGGGHARAGGCAIHGTLAEAESAVLGAARALLKA